MTTAPRQIIGALRLDDALDATCAAFANRSAIRAGEHDMSYQDLFNAADALSGRLIQLGMQKNEPVLAAVSNHIGDIATLYGIWKAGGVAVPIHRSTSEKGIRNTAARAKARTLVDFSIAGSHTNLLNGLADIHRLSQSPPPAREILDEALLVVYTSGSTGEPKGVVHGHDRFTAKMVAINEAIKLPDHGHVLVPLQITFVYAQWVILTTLLRGGEVVLATPFRADEFFGMLRDDPIAVAVVPTMLRHLQKHVEEQPLFQYSGALFSGGEPLPASLGHFYQNAWPDISIWDVYGSTETASSDFYVAPGDYKDAAGSIGRPAPGILYRFDDHTSELQIQTPFIMRGYLDEPSLTASAFDNDYFLTGDQAREREDGFVVITDRLKNLVVRAGNKISPIEVETIFMEHPGISSALAAGVPDVIKGEQLHLMVVPCKGMTLDTDDMITWGSARLDRYKLPDHIHIVAELPTGKTGKTDRNEMKKIILSQSVQPVPGVVS